MPFASFAPEGLRLVLDALELRRDREGLLELLRSAAQPDRSSRTSVDERLHVVLWSSPFLRAEFVSALSCNAPVQPFLSAIRSLPAAALVISSTSEEKLEVQPALEASVLFAALSRLAPESSPDVGSVGVLRAAAARFVASPVLFGELFPAFSERAASSLFQLLGGELPLFASALRAVPSSSASAFEHVAALWRGFGRPEGFFDLLPVLSVPGNVEQLGCGDFASALLERLASLLPSRGAREVFASLSGEFGGTLGELCEVARRTGDS